jgi:hypothetical protein
VVGVGGVAAVHAVAEKEAPKPAAATALVTATNAQSTASALAFKVHPGDPLACAEAYRKAFRMLKALPDPLTTSWITNGPAEVIQRIAFYPSCGEYTRLGMGIKRVLPHGG